MGIARVAKIAGRFVTQVRAVGYVWGRNTAKSWKNRLAYCAQFVLSVTCGAIAAFLCVTSVGSSSPDMAPAFVFIVFIIGLVLVLPNTLTALIVHELGHCVGARPRGMTVSQINIAGAKFHAQRHGWRVRWGGRIK